MVDKVHIPVSSPVTSAFPKVPVGRLNHKIPLNDFRAGCITRLQSFTNVQASEFAATQVVPTAGIQFECQGGRGVYIRAVRGSLPPRVSDMQAVRIGQLSAEVFHLLDLQPCWLLLDFHHLLLAGFTGAGSCEPDGDPG